eukprot:scaffold16400_cov36-Tisochrysis_lutea.AAC.1
MADDEPYQRDEADEEAKDQHRYDRGRVPIDIAALVRVDVRVRPNARDQAKALEARKDENACCAKRQAGRIEHTAGENGPHPGRQHEEAVATVVVRRAAESHGRPRPGLLTTSAGAAPITPVSKMAHTNEPAVAAMADPLPANMAEAYPKAV